jgi:outer membrane murein-binding lipoprotein Lpp
MSKRAFTLAALSFGVCAGLAGPSPATARQTPASTAQAQDFNAEFDALVERLNAARSAFQEEMNKLYEGFDEDKASAEEKAAFEKKSAELEAKDPSPTYVKEFAALAERAKGTDTAAKALIKVLELDATKPGSGVTAGGEALATLLSVHIKSPELAKLPTALSRARSLDTEQRKKAFRKLNSDCPIESVKASALYSLGNLLLDDGSEGSGQAEARQSFIELKQKFGALVSNRRGKTYGALADAVLFELDHLAVGSLAPDFEVIDETGAKFKLSDYKGKVVVVDFWGNW